MRGALLLALAWFAYFARVTALPETSCFWNTKVAKPAFIEEDEGILRTLAAQQPHRLRPASVPRGRRDAGPQPGPFAAVLAELGTTVKKGECKDQGTSDKCSILADTGKKCCWCVNLDAEIAECLDEKDAKVKLALDPNLICDPPPEDDGGGGSGSDDDEGGGGSGSDGGGGSADKITLLPGYQLTPMQICGPICAKVNERLEPAYKEPNGITEFITDCVDVLGDVCHEECLSLTPLVSRLLDGYRETNAPQEMSESRLVLAFDWARYPSGGDLAKPTCRIADCARCLGEGICYPGCEAQGSC